MPFPRGCAKRSSRMRAFNALASRSGLPSISFTFKLSAIAEAALRPIVAPTPLSITVCLSNPKPFLLKYFLFLSFPFLLLLFLFTTTTNHQPPPENPSTTTPKDIRIRPGYASYESYIQRQLNKTLNPKLRKIWTTRDWDRKIRVFSGFFADLKRQGLLRNDSRALCIGARVGQEVESLRRVGVSDSVGIDLVPYPPLVVEGDFHAQPFKNDTFDFEFSNVFDHALYPRKFVGEIERTLKPGGVCVLHVALSRRSDKYSANDLYSVEALVELFGRSELVRVGKVDGFGLDTEVVFRKKMVSTIHTST